MAGNVGQFNVFPVGRFHGEVGERLSLGSGESVFHASRYSHHRLVGLIFGRYLLEKSLVLLNGVLAAILLEDHHAHGFRYVLPHALAQHVVNAAAQTVVFRAQRLYGVLRQRGVAQGLHDDALTVVDVVHPVLDVLVNVVVHGAAHRVVLHCQRGLYVAFLHEHLCPVGLIANAEAQVAHF